MVTQTVGQPKIKVDAAKLAQGKPAFTDDIELRGMLFAKVLRSPVAHARILRIDTTAHTPCPASRPCSPIRISRRVAYSTAGPPTRCLRRWTHFHSMRKCASSVIGWRSSPPKPRQSLNRRWA